MPYLKISGFIPKRTQKCKQKQTKRKEKKRNEKKRGSSPFPEPVNTKTRGQIPKGRPADAISSPTATTAAFAAVNDEYMYEEPRDRNGVEKPKLKNPAPHQAKGRGDHKPQNGSERKQNRATNPAVIPFQQSGSSFYYSLR